jgi:NAD(P)-dependent dehydrogenase (short-subunit alcohol dehydrogenase family)
MCVCVCQCMSKLCCICGIMIVHTHAPFLIMCLLLLSSMRLQDDNAVTTPEHVWDLTMNINVKGVWFGCKHGIEAMKRSGEPGSVINTASFVCLRGAATPQIAYTTSKGAVLAMTRELAVFHARDGIRVNSLCPGPLQTKLLMDFLDTEEKKQRRLVHVPMGRFGEAREMANGALFLASDEASFVTGTDFLVDGGLCAAYVTPEGEPKQF